MPSILSKMKPTSARNVRLPRPSSLLTLVCLTSNDMLGLSNTGELKAKSGAVEKGAGPVGR